MRELFFYNFLSSFLITFYNLTVTFCSILNSMSFDIKFNEFFSMNIGFSRRAIPISGLVLTLHHRFPRYVFIRAKDFVTLLTKSILARYTVCKIDVNISIYIYYDIEYKHLTASSVKSNRGAYFFIHSNSEFDSVRTDVCYTLKPLYTN